MTGFWRTVSRICALFIYLCSSAIAAQNDLIILLANSESMQRNDPESLTARALEGYLHDISGDTRVAVLSFADHVSRIHPFTSVDPGEIGPLLERIRGIRPEGGHSNSAAGMERSIYELKTQGRPGADKAIILITDTYIHTGDRSRDLDFERWLREILAQEAATARIRVFGIALGEQADIQNLQTMAFKTGGEYYRASDAGEIRTLLSRVHGKITGIEQQPEPTTTVEQVVTPNSVPPPTDIAGYSDTGQGIAQRPLSGRDEDAESFVTDREAADSPELSAVPQHPHTEIDIHSAGVETNRTEGRVSEWLGGSSLLLPILAASIALFGIAAYLILRTKKHRGPPRHTQSHTGDRIFPCMLEDVHEITGRQYYDISGRLTWISRTPGENSAHVRTIVIHDDRISREHALIQFKKNGYWISDRDSGNGSFVNGHQVVDERRLKHGDSLRFASIEFRFLSPHQEKPPAPPNEGHTLSSRREQPRSGPKRNSETYAASEQASSAQGWVAHHERNQKKSDAESKIGSESPFTGSGKLVNDGVGSGTGSANKGDTEELTSDKNPLKENGASTNNLHVVTRPPQQRPTTTTDEFNDVREETEELPPIEPKETAAKPSTQDSERFFKQGEKFKLPCPAQEEEDDKTRSQPNE